MLRVRLQVEACGKDTEGAVKISNSKASSRSPKDPFIRIDPAYDCDGFECRSAIPDEEGNLEVLPPHFHLIEWELDAEFRCYAVGGELPEDVYEPSH
jgi:hypothetical protein